MKEILRKNYISTIYILGQLSVVVFGSFKDNLIGERYSISTAVLYHVICLLFFMLGYLPTKFNLKKYEINKQYVISSKFPFFAYICILVGLITSISTIGSIISPTEYLNLLLSGGQGIADIRMESGEGGLKGIFKMLNYLPLGIYLISSSYYNFLNISDSDKKKLLKIKNISLVASIIKVLFALDRLTILAIILVLIYENVMVKKIKPKIVVGGGIMLILLSFITANRMGDIGILEFLVVYFKLSLVNYELVIEHYDQWTYGWNTFLMPLWYILKFFDINKDIAIPDKWVWNPAQYFNSSFYVDFGIFSLIFYLFIGLFIRKLQTEVNRSNKKYISLYFIIAFAISTFVSVPFIRGIEFWVLICLSFMCVKFVRYKKNV